MKLLKLSLLSLTLAIPSLSFAAGGSDPIIGIDIIIKKDPGSQPIANIPFTDSEINQYNELRESDRPAYLNKVIVPKLERVNKKYNYDIKWNPIIEKGIEQQWCITVPCDAKTTVVMQLTIPENLKESEVKFTLASQSDAVIERRTIKRVVQMERR
ncbi:MULTISPECIES: hypothetical protein [Psychrobacter]|jgi:hypothetical protein|uniref:hypothetical protein n=1 Tax=Psychrobacter TaxID=497 RepID=UPI00086D850B|nr:MULTISPECIES: hypothetical protein [Psychrobacter]MBA6244224.1 hypothetical protein [Psychrobacter sp. Urea-trap-18]MBA6286642.1 hypothetical protein [Psychrobacter sp. Urea-trap-16]MBA6317639.1 hypothetical protein [Psychrobacter sp. Urea-trap-20]MBA6334253.1 hypothetical protein [Psychrobacter sp. Urea-trap-19]OEH67525.1 MAG: hypothetical protein BAX61_11450 [Psychrobacter sp. B29-1]|tara:strand:+ start:616 stop:1083 length:468 start_codon:yes stop_codon:yes gene_type:complete